MIYSQLSAQFIQTSGQIVGGIALFIWQTLTRFAKTVGILAIIAGCLVAIGDYRQHQPRIDALKYQESGLLPERLRRVQDLYGRTERGVMALTETDALPAQSGNASVELQFPSSIVSPEAFEKASQELAKVSLGKEVLKRWVTDRFETNVSEIQKTLRAHAETLKPAPPTPQKQTPAPAVELSPFDGLYIDGMGNWHGADRQRALTEASEVLATLRSTAKDPENQRKLDGAIAELARFRKLFEEKPSPPVVPPANDNGSQTELLAAEKVAVTLDQMRNQVRNVLFSAWALDGAYDQALQTLEQERSRSQELALQVGELQGQIFQTLAKDIAIGLAVGLFFLLIGDWTQKASTIVHEYWHDLIPDFQASPEEVYSIVESTVQQRQVPDLECSRQLWHEGGAISPKREYLRLARQRQCFEICAAPFGTGFFVSYRVTEVPLVIDPLGILLLLLALSVVMALLIQMLGLQGGILALILILCVAALALRSAISRGLGQIDKLLMKMPLLAPLYELYLRPVTYYRIDSMQMYHQAVRSAVSEAFQNVFPDQPMKMKSDLVHPPAHPQFSHW